MKITLCILLLLTAAAVAKPVEARHGGIHVGTAGCKNKNMRSCRGRLEEHNRIADEYGLKRIQPGESVTDFVREQGLVYVTDSPTIEFTAVEDYRYLTPTAYSYLKKLTSKFYKEFGEPLKVTSMLRTREYQFLLIRRKISDADCRTEVRCSTHLTGATFDISKRVLKKTMSRKEQAWMKSYLFRYWQQEKIDPIEEDAAFHIMVLPSD